LDAEQKKLDEANSKAEEWVAKKKESSVIVKNLAKEHINLNKAKDKTLKEKLKAIAVEQKSKIKTVQTELKSLRKQLATIQK
jgi:hypothetical protein